MIKKNATVYINDGVWELPGDQYGAITKAYDTKDYAGLQQLVDEFPDDTAIHGCIKGAIWNGEATALKILLSDGVNREWRDIYRETSGTMYPEVRQILGRALDMVENRTESILLRLAKVLLEAAADGSLDMVENVIVHENQMVIGAKNGRLFRLQIWDVTP